MPVGREAEHKKKKKLHVREGREQHRSLSVRGRWEEIRDGALQEDKGGLT